MIRKIISIVVLLPLAILIVLFAVANRQIVSISLDPLSSDTPAYALTVPLFVALILALIIGAVIGGIASWMKQSRWRRAARQLESEAALLRRQSEELRERLAETEPHRLGYASDSSATYRTPPAAS
ncbi:MAG TPA: LapA family protein [Xanthobacteraceae bacterium]|jgi:uncharacterized integral membrane protein|nr:LapA family protein [Xanthobacteraceae bacterium]